VISMPDRTYPNVEWDTTTTFSSPGTTLREKCRSEDELDFRLGPVRPHDQCLFDSEYGISIHVSVARGEKMGHESFMISRPHHEVNMRRRLCLATQRRE